MENQQLQHLIIKRLLKLFKELYQTDTNSTSDKVVFLAGSDNTDAAVLDLQAVSHIRFKNIIFQDERRDANAQYVVRLSNSSKDCQFLNCQFAESALNRTVIYSSGADSLLVDGCNFIGGGIDKRDLAKIFERFYKVDKSRSFDVKGAGMGLYIVRTLTELNGGKISVNSTPGEYAEFVFTVPLA